jgi:hypothetical protein
MSAPVSTSLLSLAGLLALATLGACAGKPMAVQDPLSEAPSMPIVKKGKVASFGAWINTRTKGGAIRTVSVAAGPWGAQAVQQDFEYDTTGGGTAFSSTCAFDASGQNVAFSKFGENSAFACTLTPEGGEPWTLFLAREGQGRQALLNGKFEGGGEAVDITMTRAYADGSTPLSPVGYHFLVAGAPVAAVQLNNPPQVWMSTELAPPLRDAVAAGIGALIFSYPAVQQTFTSL